MTPLEVEALTFWQYTAMIHEHNRRQINPTGVEPMTDEELDDHIEELRSWNLPDMKV
jgi:hypothetical protein